MAVPPDTGQTNPIPTPLPAVPLLSPSSSSDLTPEIPNSAIDPPPSSHPASDPLLILTHPSAPPPQAASSPPTPPVNPSNLPPNPLLSHEHCSSSLHNPDLGHPPPPPNLKPRPPHPPAPRSSAPPIKSYAQAARGPRGPGFVRSHASDVESFARLPRTGVNIICGTREGIPSFSFVNSDLPKVEELYANALVMRFHGGRPSLEASHKEILSWGIEKPFSIGPLSSRAFLLRFQDQIDLIKVLSRPSSILITFPYKVFRWHNLCHIKDDSCYAPVWISLPKLPLQCFIPEFLESVANKIGRFLCFDKATATLARPSAARMCVEIDLRKPSPPFIWVGLYEGVKQPIIYERKPKFCNSCQAQGHLTMECPWGHRETLPPQPNPHPPPIQSRPPPVRRNAPAYSAPTFPPISATAHPSTSSRATAILPDDQAPVLASPAPNAQLQPSAPNPTFSSPAPQQISHSQSNSPSDRHQASVYPPASNNNIQHSTDLPAIPNNPPEIPSHTNRVTSLPSSSVQANPSTNIPPSHPITPHKDPPPSSSKKAGGHHKRKSVSFAPSNFSQTHDQTNLEANKNFWEAVNRQMSVIEQARLNSSSAPLPNPEHEDALLSEDNQHIDESASDSSVEAVHPPYASSTLMQDAQDPYDDFSLKDQVSYASEGEEQSVDPTPLEGYATDDPLSKAPQTSKRNKRHPDQPLKVQLRVRKDPNPSS